jgi:predicted GH43/DUF377 family glycosyl hydrolase
MTPPVSPGSSTYWEWPEIFNPGVVVVNGVFHMLYRGADFGDVSSIGAATSSRGYQFTPVSSKPVITAMQGVEDPRLYYHNGTYYSFFTGHLGSRLDINEAVSDDGTTWKQLGPVVSNTRDAAVVADPEGRPVQVGGKYLMYYGQMGAAYLAGSTDLVHWRTIGRLNMKFPASYEPWELCVAVTNYPTTATGAVNRGIDVFVAGGLMGHGRWYYAISEVQFSRADLLVVHAQLNIPVLRPQADYEVFGRTPNTVFMNNIIFDQNKWWMYYGAGDSVIALAQAGLR